MNVLNINIDSGGNVLWPGPGASTAGWLSNSLSFVILPTGPAAALELLCVTGTYTFIFSHQKF